MSTATQTETKTITLEKDELFILMLLPNLRAFGIPKPLELEIMGHSIEDWVEDTVAHFPYRKVDVGAGDDIISLVKRYETTHKYTMVVYGDMPLLTKESIDAATGFAKMFGHKAVRLPRGWLFETEYIMQTKKIETADISHLDYEDFLAVYNWSQLEKVTRVMQRRINERHMMNGVRIMDSATTYIDYDVEIEKGVVIEPGTIIKGKAIVRSGSNLGPYAHIRKGNTTIGRNCKIGNYVELKNAEIGDGTKISHLTYVGDATIGKNCNLGCGVVFCNYDGKQKHHTKLGDNVFVGSNVNFVSPINVEDGAIIAAGSTITEDVCKDCLAIARERQINKEPKVKEQVKEDKKDEVVVKIEPIIETVIEPEIEEASETVFSKEIRQSRSYTEVKRSEIEMSSECVEEQNPEEEDILKEESIEEVELGRDLQDGIELGVIEQEKEKIEEPEPVEVPEQEDDLEVDDSDEDDFEDDDEEIIEELEIELDEEDDDYPEELEETGQIIESEQITKEENAHTLDATPTTPVEMVDKNEIIVKDESEDDDEPEILLAEEDESEELLVDDKKDSLMDGGGLLDMIEIPHIEDEVEEEDDCCDDECDGGEECPLPKDSFDWDNPDGDIEEFYQGRD
ncbi:MAG: hypothetical protein FWE45_01475 [Firmicutes bacterium]|nr:hypothetical protein [Bacillota bacterium]